MGLLVEGQWQDRWYNTKKSGGRFIRNDSSFRNWITADGQAGPSGQGGFKAEVGRYHLYVALACPWAHRTLIFRKLKGLEEMISLSVVNTQMGAEGWTFEAGEGVIPDPIHNATRLYEIYQKADPHYTGRVTVPVLWDKKHNTIVSNESAEIIRMFNSAFDQLGAYKGDYYPEPLRNEIDQLNEKIYHTINNGVYKAGFATTQSAYEEAVIPLFDMLDKLEQRLEQQRYLLGAQITETDWRLFTTLLRFDPVYFGHFKCNLKRIVDYPQLSGYLRDLYQHPGIADTVNFKMIKAHYYGSHPQVNPTGVIPVGPLQNLEAPHQRAQLS